MSSTHVVDPDKGLDAFLKVTETTGSMKKKTKSSFSHRRKGHFKVGYTNSTTHVGDHFASLY